MGQEKSFDTFDKSPPMHRPVKVKRWSTSRLNNSLGSVGLLCVLNKIVLHCPEETCTDRMINATRPFFPMMSPRPFRTVSHSASSPTTGFGETASAMSLNPRHAVLIASCPEWRRTVAMSIGSTSSGGAPVVVVAAGSVGTGASVVVAASVVVVAAVSVGVIAVAALKARSETRREGNAF